MIYHNFKGMNLSALGLGCLRFPVIDGDAAKVDDEATQKLVDYAIANGVNCFDTAFGYHGGTSESVMGRMLSKYPRDAYYLSTKFPGYEADNFNKVDEIFREQLRRCQTDYFDFYLLHNVCEENVDAYMDDEKNGLMSYLRRRKEDGTIRHLGLSTHGSLETMKRFLDAYGEDMEFCLIQLNFFDWTFQKAKEKVELLKRYGLPIWVMEPLRGGKLVPLMEEEGQILKKLRPNESIPAWGFRFLQGIDGVLMVLSGMSNEQQVKENIQTFSQYKPLTHNEQEALLQVSQALRKRIPAPCTACRYCTPYCPQQLDIPALLERYNKHHVRSETELDKADSASTSPSAACIGCRRCERVCPQNIPISQLMKELSDAPE